MTLSEHNNMKRTPTVKVNVVLSFEYLSKHNSKQTKSTNLVSILFEIDAYKSVVICQKFTSQS